MGLWGFVATGVFDAQRLPGGNGQGGDEAAVVGEASLWGIEAA